MTMAAANADSLLKDAMGTKSSNTCEKKYRSRSRYGTEIEKLEAGDFFGHNALLQRDETSLHSVFANEPLELLAIKTDTFTRVLLQPFQEDFHTKAEYLSRIEFFSGWSPHLIRQLIFTLRERKYHVGECIFRQDISTHCMYLVKSGSVKLSTHCSRKPPDEMIKKIEPERDYLAEILAEDQPPPVKEPPIESLSKVSLTSGLSRVSIVAGMSQTFLRRESAANPFRRESKGDLFRRESKPDLLVRRESKASLSLSSLSRRGSLTPAAMLNLLASEKKKAKQNKQEKKPYTKPVHLLGFKLQEPCPDNTIEICNLGPEELLGEIEAMCQLKHHLFNAVCMTTTVVYEVDLFHIEQLLHKKAPRTLYCILQHIIQKVESWQARHRCIQFFEPLKTLLDQVDKRMTAEGANKPMRRQHNYDASTLALMATRSFGKPIAVIGNKTQRKSVAFIVEDNFKDVNCTPFSSLYGCANTSPLNSPMGTFRRCLSSPANIVVNRTLASNSSLPPNQMSGTLDDNPKPRHRHRSAPSTSSRRIPKPITKKTFSFDVPPPRQYRTKPNLMSSARFPIPPPSPYPFQEDQDMIDILKQNKEEQSEEDRIETISLDSSPAHREQQRCKSAGVHRVCTQSPLPVRPNTTVPFSNRSRSVTPISIDSFSPLSTPSKKVLDDLAHSASDISIFERLVDNDESPRATTATPIVIPLATTSDGDLCNQECGNNVDEVSPNEEMLNENRISDGDSFHERDAESAEEALHTEPVSVDTVGTVHGVNRHHKQVRISNKLEFLGPKYLSIAMHGAYVLPMKEVGNLQLQPANVEVIAQASTAANDKPYLDDTETSTTIPEEYAKLQEGCQPNSQSSTVKSPSDPNIVDCANEGARECSGMATGSAQTSREQSHRELTTSPAYKCISMSFTTPMDYQTRSVFQYIH